MIVFSLFPPHHEVARSQKIKSSGFCELEFNEGWMVSGGSHSLECRSRPQDVEILNQHRLGSTNKPAGNLIYDYAKIT